MSIETEVIRRKITQLVHFTNVTNLPNILKNGLIPRDQLVEVDYEFNDPLRIDGHLNATCLSITHPNSKMFYKFRMASPETKWAIILINPKILWEKNCAFYSCNAASNRVRLTAPDTLSDENSFSAMFAENVGDISRQGQNLALNHPTDVQAEVLVFGTIEPSCFDRIIYSEKSTADAYCSYNKRVPHNYYPSINNAGLYSARSYILG